jgi:DNA invertase Pin-like site-specific DNA recombinase/predicted DNA-binding transcriptional regulator AlpA
MEGLKMSEAKIGTSHLARNAYVYIRQSTASQVENNRESTARQYALEKRALQLGWPSRQIVLIDEDLAQSGADSAQRSGFVKMNGEVALGRAGVILSIEVSRVARNNSDWYKLLDLCSITDTLIADEDGVYHPGLFNDRLLLGLKGTMAEAELHILRARLNGGIQNKAARGELRRGLPVGFIWGEEDGEILINPDKAIATAIRNVFDKFREFGSARRVWLWFRNEGISFPHQMGKPSNIRWESPSYTKIHQVLTNPVYAGAYTYGKSRTERYINDNGTLSKRTKRLPQNKWAVLINDHHKGFIEWKTYEMNLERLGNNTHPEPHQAGGAIREGAALLQGIAVCGKCGRKLKTFYHGNNSTPGYYCANNTIVNGRGLHCMRISGLQIDKAVSVAFLQAIEPAGIEAALVAGKDLIAGHNAALRQWKLQVERARYEADRAQKRYEAVDPQNRLVAQTLEQQWEMCLTELATAEVELNKKEREFPLTLSNEQRQHIRLLGSDLQSVWNAVTTTDRDRKVLLRTILEEVIIEPRDKEAPVRLCLRWRGGMITELQVSLPPRHQPTIKTEEDTIELIRRLADHYDDGMIAGILNRQGRKTAQNLSFNANRVGNIRRHWNIPTAASRINSEGELLTIEQTAKVLGTAPSTIHRWLNDGFIAGEQLTPGAPWRIRMTDELKAFLVDEAPKGYVTMQEATKILGVSRQTVLQRVKRGELSAIHVRNGKRKGLKIKALDNNPTLFDHLS